MTDNEHWIYLEKLRRSGIVNMYGAAPYLKAEFGIAKLSDAQAILTNWMMNYKRSDYDGLEEKEGIL